MRSSGSWNPARVLVNVALTLAIGLFETAAPPAVVAADTDELEVKVEPDSGIRARARLVFEAKPGVLFAILTDYAHWPDLFEVRMRLVDLTMHGAIARTDLRIEHALLPGERRLVTDSRTVTDRSIVTDLVQGDFKRYHRAWRLSPADGGAHTLAEFELLVAIDSMVPDWLVAFAMRRELESHFRIVKKKAMERAAAER
ncbi:MAG: SRPBCC family protein [Nitrospira sp.]|nr:SRPBCC family protein [Nitrospira sp.]